MVKVFKLNEDQKVTTLLIVFGAVTGLISNYTAPIFFFLAFAIPAVIFSATIYGLIKILKPNKVKKFLIEHFVTFVLVWMVVWTYFNTK